MSCTNLISAWPPADPAKDKQIVFSPTRSYAGARAFDIPCGRCLGCRHRKASDWATRINHEMMFHEWSWFLTCTYADEFLPAYGGLDPSHHTDFMKRLRFKYGPARFFMCGEYGGRFGRPHFHYALMGPDIPDRVLWTKSKSGRPLFRSPELEEVWGFGRVEFGALEYGAGKYMAGYITKSVAEASDPDYLSRIDPATGEVVRVHPPFIRMSRRPGIGAPWLEAFGDTDLNGDFVIIDGVKRAVPRFYTLSLSERQQLVVRAKRKAAAMLTAEERTPRRLMTKRDLYELRERERLRQYGER